MIINNMVYICSNIKRQHAFKYIKKCVHDAFVMVCKYFQYIYAIHVIIKSPKLRDKFLCFLGVYEFR